MALFEIASFGAIVVLVVLGLGIIASMMGIFNFAHGEFVLLGVGSGNRFTRRTAMPRRAPERHAQRTCPQAIGDDPAHRLEVRTSRGVVCTVPHDETANRRMRNLSTHIDRARHPLESIQVLAE